jgi:CDP-glycerol glycerophosphotransferase
MPRISVVVPIYNVEPYLDECLDSIAGQTYRDLEVVMVDDGSKDNSPAIAERWVSKDKRFRLVTQPNGGLGNARNTGIKNAGGELLAFVDSDDYLAPNAYQLLVEALDETGSDFATGNVLRLQSQGVRQAYFLAEAFAKTRLKTHVSEYRPLIADRIAWNKLFRREFWDRQGREFPEGVLNEDIPVILPAHFAAKSVDVIADPIYYWRSRDSDELSITQRRLEPKALRDRLAAMDQVVDWLDEHGKGKWKRWYFEGIVADDLRLYVNPLSGADEQYRELFLDKVNAFLDRAPKGIYDPLPAIDRLRWHLVRRRLMPELLEVLRFQREELRDRPPVEIRGRWYGDYPFREDKRLEIPRSVYLLEGELGLRVEIDSLDWDGDRLQVKGNAFIRGIGAARPDTQQLKVVALRRGRLRRVRIRLTAVKLDAKLVRRPDVTAAVPQRLADLEWAGFEASLDPRKLRSRGRWRPGVWELFVIVRAGKVHRRRATRFHFNPLRPLRGVEMPLSADVKAKVIPTASRSILVDIRTQWANLLGHRLDGKRLELTGGARGPHGEKPRLAVVRRADDKTFKYKMEIEEEGSPAKFTTRVKLADVLEADRAEAAPEEAEDEEEAAAEAEDDGAEDAEDREAWDLEALGGGPARSVGLAADAGAIVWRGDGRELALLPTRKLDATLVEQVPRPLVREAEWSEGGELRVAGDLPQGIEAVELLLVARDYGDVWSFPADAAEGRFSATLTPAHAASLAGTVPLREARWELYARAPGAGDAAARVPVALARELHERLPVSTVVEKKPFALTATYDDRAVLVAERDLEEAERGQYNQRLLRENVYVARRQEPLRDAVLFTSFDGRQFSDSPRAIHEELVRRGSPLEQLWVVRDAQFAVPGTARAVRELSREWYEALASARYVVTNDHFPPWFRRRPDQVCLQTWHSAPLKPLGLDVTSRRQQLNPADWERQLDNWQYVLSPSRFATPIVKRAFGLEHEPLETGYPRTDVLSRPDRDALGLELRRRIGIPDGKRTVLYAPTFRNRVFDRRGNYLLDTRLDLERLRVAVGEDTVVLFRRHPYVADPAPAEPRGFVHDVSSYPDATELALAADVLVTDYSSIMFDFANTGRPMLFYAYDLDSNGDASRFYLDYEATVPGPVVRTTDELGEALRSVDALRAEYAARYDEFRKTFCELDDGRAAERVVERVFVE